MKRPVKRGDEQDLVTGWRHRIIWQRGEKRAIKARLSRRFRRQDKESLRQGREV